MTDSTAENNLCTLETQRSKSGLNSQILEDLYRQYWQELCVHIKRKFGGGPPEPEDVAQTAFTRYASLDKPEQVENPRAFLFTTARNIVIDHKRKDGSHFNYTQSVLASSAYTKLDKVTPERVIQEKERFEILCRTVAELPHKQKVVLSLHRFHGNTYQQIVKETGWSYGDVYRQMEKALATLAAALKSNG